MIKLENYEVVGWEHAIRGMRNPKNSWAKSDSTFKETTECDILGDDGAPDKMFVQFDALMLGPNDYKLAKTLSDAGPVHGKFRRMIDVYVDITAPLYWWKEFDTYKVGTVANSCSTMHKIHDKEFTLEDFSHEHLLTCDKLPETSETPDGTTYIGAWFETLDNLIFDLNLAREAYLKTKDKKYWWQMIQLLPSSYNQKRTVKLNYEVLANIYEYRRDHKLDEWHTFCDWIKGLPYSSLITGGVKNAT